MGKENLNHHGRIFGPYLIAGRAVFAAAFSREAINPLQKVKHDFHFFNRGRDAHAAAMDRRNCFKIRKFVQMENAIILHPLFTTGNHDGVAALLFWEKHATH